MRQKIKVVDLFAGPGGLGEGFASIGPDDSPFFDIVVSVEKEVSAHKTLTLRAFTRRFENRTLPEEYYEYVRGNITKDKLIATYPDEWAAACDETLGRPVALGEDNELIHQKIKEALGNNEAPWILIGGPPCQAYSLAGRARNSGSEDYVAEEDGRHFLYKEYLEIIEKFKPAIFIMENVKGMLSSSPAGHPIFNQILSDLKNPGNLDLNYNIFSLSSEPQSNDLFGAIYKHRDFIVKAENYGVPQARHRVILLGVLADIDVDVSKIVLSKSSKVNIGQILTNMPKLRSGLSKENDAPDNWQKVAVSALKTAAFAVDVDISKLLKGVLPKFRGRRFFSRKLSFSKNLPSGLKDWMSDENLKGIIQHETRSHMRSDIARYAYVSLFGKRYKRSPLLDEFPEHLMPNHKNINSGKFVDRFKSQVKHLPCKTITSHISKDSHAFIHFDPIQARGLTVREAARIQTFPDNYFFEGNRTQQYVQVGNAVPPFLANKIGEIVSSLIATSERVNSRGNSCVVEKKV